MCGIHCCGTLLYASHRPDPHQRGARSAGCATLVRFEPDTHYSPTTATIFGQYRESPQVSRQSCSTMGRLRSRSARRRPPSERTGTARCATIAACLRGRQARERLSTAPKAVYQQTAHCRRHCPTALLPRACVGSARAARLTARQSCHCCWSCWCYLR